ncbi:helix-turn-helix transcriptional regulator [Microbacterium tumbae]
MDRGGRQAARKAEEVFRNRWYDLDEDHVRLILDAVDALDDESLGERPLLVTAGVIAYQLKRTRPGAPVESGALLERFASVVERLGGRAHADADPTSATLRILMKMVSARWRGDYGRAVELTELLRDRSLRGSLKDAVLDRGTEEIRPGQIALQCGVTELLRGDLPAAMLHFIEAHRAGGDPPHRHFAKVGAMANAAMTAAVDGQADLTARWLDRIGRAAPVPDWCEEAILAGATIARGILAADRLDLTEAGRYAADLTRLSEGSELWPFAIYAQCSSDLMREEPVRALRRLREAGFERGRRGAPESIAGGILLRARLDALLLNGEGSMVLRLSERHGDPVRTLVPRARTHLLAGDAITASRIAARALRTADLPKRDLWESHLISAVAELRLGDRTEARMRFGQLVQAAPGSLPALLHRAPRGDIEDLYTLIGRTPPAEAMAAEDANPVEIVTLTPRESHVLMLWVGGMRAGEIAQKEVVSEHTVRTQIKRIYRKLGVSSRTEAVRRAHLLGILDVDRDAPDGVRSPRKRSSR